jgi:hypothetical protein
MASGLSPGSSGSQAVGVLLVCHLALAAWPGLGLAAYVDVGGGVSISEPVGMSALDGQPPPVTRAWSDPAGTMSVEVVPIPAAVGTAASLAKEFNDWPAVGRSMAQGYGRANIKALGKALSAECTFTGEPLARDPERMLMHVRVIVSCDTSPAPTRLRADLIMVITAAGQVMVRVSSMGGEPAAVDRLVASVWESLRVSPAQRFVGPMSSEPRPTDRNPDAKPVSGGPGIRLTDYGLINTPSLVGLFLGAVFAALAFGALFSALLVRLGARPWTALIVAQGGIFLLAMWGESRDGVWEIDWLCRGIPALAGAALLKGWIQTRWERRQAKLAGSRGSEPPASPPDEAAGNQAGT